MRGTFEMRNVRSRAEVRLQSEILKQSKQQDLEQTLIMHFNHIQSSPHLKRCPCIEQANNACQYCAIGNSLPS